MNPVFWLLVILAAVAVWFFVSMLFKPLGTYLFRIWKDAMKNLEIEEENEEETK